MNKQIKQLAAQCWDERLDGRHFDQEMFAKLIIQKCITLISPDIRDFDQAFGIKQHCITQIKEHFKISTGQ